MFLSVVNAPLILNVIYIIVCWKSCKLYWLKTSLKCCSFIAELIQEKKKRFGFSKYVHINTADKQIYWNFVRSTYTMETCQKANKWA